MITSILEIEGNNIILVGENGFMGIFNLDKMEQVLIMPQQFGGENVLSITKILNSTFAVGTSNGVYIMNKAKKDNNPTIMMQEKRVRSVKLIKNGNIICGSVDGYYMVNIEKKEEKLLTGDRQRVYNICLLSSIDAKYNDLALTLEKDSVNILNMSTGSIVKIQDVTTEWFLTDSMMQLMRNSNEDNFSFVFIAGEYEICKLTVRKELADLCLL